MAQLKSKLVEQEVGENRYHDIAVTREAFDEKLFFESVHEHRLFVPRRGKEVPVEFVMFREDVVNDVLANWVEERPSMVNNNLVYTTYTYENIISDLDRLLNG